MISEQKRAVSNMRLSLTFSRGEMCSGNGILNAGICPRSKFRFFIFEKEGKRGIVYVSIECSTKPLEMENADDKKCGK